MAGGIHPASAGGNITETVRFWIFLGAWVPLGQASAKAPRIVCGRLVYFMLCDLLPRDKKGQKKRKKGGKQGGKKGGGRG